MRKALELGKQELLESGIDLYGMLEKRMAELGSEEKDMKEVLAFGMKVLKEPAKMESSINSDKTTTMSANLAIFNLAENLAARLYEKKKNFDEETRLERFVLSTAVSRLAEEGDMEQEIESLQKKCPGLIARPPREPQRDWPGLDLDKVLLAECPERRSSHREYREFYREMKKEGFEQVRNLRINGQPIDSFIFNALQVAAPRVLTHLGYQR
jgi:hypothetical protein